MNSFRECGRTGVHAPDVIFMPKCTFALLHFALFFLLLLRQLRKTEGKER